MLTRESIPGLLDIAYRQAKEGEYILAAHTFLQAVEVDPSKMMSSFVWHNIAAVVTGDVPHGNWSKYPILIPKDLVPKHVAAQLARSPNQCLLQGYPGPYVNPPTEAEIRKLIADLRGILQRFSKATSDSARPHRSTIPQSSTSAPLRPTESRQAAAVAKNNSAAATSKREASQPQYFVYVRQHHEGPYTYADLLCRFRELPSPARGPGVLIKNSGLRLCFLGDPSLREEATFWTKGMADYVTVDELFRSDPVASPPNVLVDSDHDTPVTDQLSSRQRGINELKRVMLSDPDSQARKEALLEFMSGEEPVEVLVLTGVAVLSDDAEIRRLTVEHLNNKGNGHRARALINSWRREGGLMTMAGAMTTEQISRSADIEGQLR